MPRTTEYSIQWSNKENTYEVVHGVFSSCLRTTEDFQYWLTVMEAFHFCSPTGYTLTLRKEPKQRGSGYWYAYKRVNGKVQKKYLGDARKVNLRTLETLARQFVEPTPTPPPKPPTPPQPPRQPTFKFTKTLESALRIYGFSAVPNKKTLINRYRELSKQYHPDVGGLHEDMVAVNLAFDYLKKFL